MAHGLRLGDPAMQLHDAQPAPLSPRPKKVAVELLLVDAELKALHPDRTAPSLPPSFKGGVGDRVDISVRGQRTVVVGCGKVGGFDREEQFWESAGAATLDAMRALRLDSAALIGPPAPQQLAA